MTTTNPTNDDDVLAEAAAVSERRLNDLRAAIAYIEETRDTQPQRLAKARAEAETARDWARIEEPWHEQVTALRAHTRDGQPTASAMPLPNIIAKEMFGARLAFDALDAGLDEDLDRVERVKNEYFTMVDGDPGLAFVLFAAALDTIATLVVPQLVEEIEQRASNWDTRVMLAEARTKAWSERVANLRGPHDRTEGDRQGSNDPRSHE